MIAQNRIPARPTTYRGVRMRSRLEARYAALLDLAGLPWEYEPRAYANELGQYLPDFEIRRFELPIVVEVRPTLDGALLATERMQIVWDSEPTATLVATWPSHDEHFGMLIARADERVWRADP